MTQHWKSFQNWPKKKWETWIDQISERNIGKINVSFLVLSLFLKQKHQKFISPTQNIFALSTKNLHSFLLIAFISSCFLKHCCFSIFWRWVNFFLLHLWWRLYYVFSYDCSFQCLINCSKNCFLSMPSRYFIISFYIILDPRVI